MAPSRPKFSLHDSTHSSTSRGRDLEAATSSSPTRSRKDSSDSDATSKPRRSSFGTASPHRKPGVIYEHQVYEPESESEAENQTLLHSYNKLAGSKRSHRLSSTNIATIASYGAMDSPGKGHFLPLNAAAEEGRPLQRTDSILRIAGLIDDRGGEFERFRKSDEEIRAASKKVRAFYEQQNEILDDFAEVDDVLDRTRINSKTGDLTAAVPTDHQSSKAEAFNRKVQLAINVNFLVNVVLLGAKIAIVFLSNSVSLVASTVDSAMDFLSTLIIFGTNRAISYKSWKSAYHFPTGKKRMEPMGVVIFSVFMVSSFIQVAIESIQRLAAHESTSPAQIPLVGLIVMGATIAVKLVMWAWCRSIKNSSVEALTQDAENDIVFNFFSILFPFIGQMLHWKVLDPIGGLVLSIYIIVEWVETLIDNVLKLTGRRASPQQHQRVAYLLTRFSPLIRGIQHLSVYHAGDHYIVEVDIVLPPNTALTAAHDVGEAAQYAIESLDGIDRAFVHVDVTANPRSGHIDR